MMVAMHRNNSSGSSNLMMLQQSKQAGISGSKQQ